MKDGFAGYELRNATSGYKQQKPTLTFKAKRPLTSSCFLVCWPFDTESVTEVQIGLE